MREGRVAALPGNTLLDPFIIIVTSSGTCAINFESDLPLLSLASSRQPTKGSTPGPPGSPIHACHSEPRVTTTPSL
ncbi:hypothetical protein E2C01_019961 [Portunus trituberculatus]|uniref:Uncharacterized protein n=1 Tax=Portunus trituberculatus TaxID=210409 RepID=A0A5B7DYN0_PORTR|nr:hypothetical protein [Portunus trituberculatus]